MPCDINQKRNSFGNPFGKLKAPIRGFVNLQLDSIIHNGECDIGCVVSDTLQRRYHIGENHTDLWITGLALQTMDMIIEIVFLHVINFLLKLVHQRKH